MSGIYLKLYCPGLHLRGFPRAVPEEPAPGWWICATTENVLSFSRLFVPGSL
ncbi:MAG: hypothetical protein V2G33_07825 [bacterium JZ-2024 1]